MVNTFLDSPIQNLDWLEKNCSLASPLRDQVLTLKQKSRFLRTCLIATGIPEAIPSASSWLTSSFETDVAFSKAIDELSSACFLPVDLEKVDSSVSYMLENVKLWEPKIKNAYAILPEQPWRREVNSPLIDPASAMDLIDSVLENLEYDLLIGSTCVVSLMKKQVKILIEKLSFLRDFIGTAAKESNIVHQEMATFLTYAHSFATKAAYFSFLCWDGAPEEVMACHTDIKLSDLLQKIMPFSSDLTETFIQLLKASTPMGPGTAKTDAIASIVKLLLQNTVESLKDRFSSILEELIYLVKFLMVLPDELTGDLERILSDIRAAAREAASFQVNEMKEEQVVEMNLVLSKSLQRMKLINAEIILIQLLDSQEVFMVSMKDKYTALHEGLKFLRRARIDLPEEKEEDSKLLSKHVEALRAEVISFIHSIHENNLMQDPVMETKLSLHILLLKIKLVKVDLSLMGLHNHKVNLVSYVKDHEIKSLHDEMEFLRTWLMGTIDVEANIEEWELFVLHLDFVVSESASLILSSDGSGMTEDMASELDLSIFRLLVKIKLIKAEVILMKLIKTPKFGLMVHMNDEVKTLQEGVRFLRTFLINPPVEEVDQLMLAKCEAIANDAASLIFSFHGHVREEEMASEMSCLHSEFADKIELFKAEIQETCLQVLFSDCCETSGTVGIFDLLDNIKDKAKSVVFVKHHVETLLGEFEFVESFLRDTAVHYNNHQEVKDLRACIKDVAGKAKYITDLLVVRDNALCYFMLWIPSAMEDIKFIKAKVMEIYDEKRYGIGADSDATAGPLRIDNIVIGRAEEDSAMTVRLISGTEKTEIISIVGMGGQGKTTLAQAVYNHPAAVQHFQIRAWCTVSEVYQTRELFFEILRDVMVVSNRIYDMDEDRLAGVLYKCLKQKRYLIVLDDIWDSAALDALRRSFPDDNSGSRIMLTTRMRNVASRADWTAHSRYLSHHESWHLLCRKAFGDTDLPHELRSILEKLIQYCSGSPLAISIMAGVLEKNKDNISCCVKLVETLLLDRDGNLLLSVLKFAYGSLPDHLKPCFLYLGEFPEDKEIPARKLFRLWITNGLIQETESKAPEDVAEEYLLEIISRNLVTISRRRHNGRVRGCRVHDVVRDVCRSMKRGEVLLS